MHSTARRLFVDEDQFEELLTLINKKASSAAEAAADLKKLTAAKKSPACEKIGEGLEKVFDILYSQKRYVGKNYFF